MTNHVKIDKKAINKDWKTAFPELEAFGQFKFYEIVGAIIIGFELIKLPRIDAYRPHFVCYPLWKKNIKECLDVPAILIEIKKSNGGQFSISLGDHSNQFLEVVESVRKQIDININGEVLLSDLFILIDNYSQRPPQGAAPNSYLQAKLSEFKLYCALYTDNANQIQCVLDEIQLKNWDVEHFLLWNVDLKKWLNSLHKTILNKDVFLNQIEVNLKDEKINSLKKNKLLG